MYRSEETGCMNVTADALEILEGTIEKYNEFRVR